MRLISCGDRNISQEIKRKVIAKLLMTFMAIFYTIVSIGLCMGAGYYGIQLANFCGISIWWVVAPLLVFTIALISYLETMGWYEKYYKNPRIKLKEWADL